METFGARTQEERECFEAATAELAELSSTGRTPSRDLHGPLLRALEVDGISLWMAKLKGFSLCQQMAMWL